MGGPVCTALSQGRTKMMIAKHRVTFVLGLLAGIWIDRHLSTDTFSAVGAVDNVAEALEESTLEEAQVALQAHLSNSAYVRIGVSKVHGVGVIAIRDIPSGTNVFHTAN